MNYAESFQEFSSKLSTTDLVMYAGAALILYVLFKDQLNPLKEWVVNIVSEFSKKSPISNVISSEVKNNSKTFLDLITNWKNTRDLAETLNCTKAVETLDSVFPFLSPSSCVEQKKNP